MKEIALSKTGKNRGKYFALVDDKDYDWLMQRNWYVAFYSNNFYVIGLKNKKQIKMHREIMRHHGLLDESKQIDHKDRNGLNNQKYNLRNATHAENQRNKKASGTSQYLGVHWHNVTIKYNSKKFGLRKYHSSKWRAAININGKTKHIGSFKNEQDAALAYNKAAIVYHGEFANLNIV